MLTRAHSPAAHLVYGAPARQKFDVEAIDSEGTAGRGSRRHRLRIGPGQLFVGLCSTAWVGFVLWLTTPWIDDLGRSITVPVAVGLIAILWIIPGVLFVRLSSFLLWEEEPEQPASAASV